MTVWSRITLTDAVLRHGLLRLSLSTSQEPIQHDIIGIIGYVYYSLSIIHYSLSIANYPIYFIHNPFGKHISLFESTAFGVDADDRFGVRLA